MGKHILNRLAFMNIYRHYSINVEKVVNRFARVLCKWDFVP